MEPTYDIQVHVQAIVTDDDGESVYDETDFYYTANVELRGTEDISDIQDVDDAAYVIDCVTHAKLRDDVENFVGDGEITEFWVDWD